ncbi:arsenate reductase (azurin) small subunit [Scytonema tolypothrichoides VB-61278]|nr:arsenate reductase (azurin) small subunit [Scytonema tolypothrichoides VB-61278]
MDDHAHDPPPPASPAEPSAPPRLSRRGLLKLGSVSSAAAVLAACAAPPAPPPEAAATAAPTAVPPTALPQPTAAPATAEAAAPATSAQFVSDVLPYPRTRLASLSDLSGGTFSATYPDPTSPVQLIKFGTQTVGGVGPDEDIVAYSGLCTHMGCPVLYNAETKIFKCPCHYSHFDANADAMLINGPATQHLPRVILEMDGEDIYAVGVQGLIYGRANNVALVD